MTGRIVSEIAPIFWSSSFEASELAVYPLWPSRSKIKCNTRQFAFKSGRCSAGMSNGRPLNHPAKKDLQCILYVSMVWRVPNILMESVVRVLVSFRMSVKIHFGEIKREKCVLAPHSWKTTPMQVDRYSSLGFLETSTGIIIKVANILVFRSKCLTMNRKVKSWPALGT